MTKFIDKTGRIAKIEMTDIETGCSWEHDFYEVGGLEIDEESGAYIVDDVEYLIEQANEFMDGIGDFQDYEPGSEKCNLVYDIDGSN